MKVIALRGDKNTGKSHTINIVYQFLLKDKWLQVQGHFRVLGNPTYEDIIDILEKDGILLGIIGMGDYIRTDGSLAKLIKELELKGCHIVICSCRNNPKIEIAVSQYQNHFFIDKTPSTGENNNRIVNGFDAERILIKI